ncbi:MAG: putative cobaltochelatase [Candidatus Tectomicrobia bacterium]|nr:putative cobaltochelatase [Candidatus Tectomicrobia bacterium]
MSLYAVFPFTAIVGQESIKLALLLNAISPAISGVLIRGHKGTAKSTAVRALSRLLPDIDVVAGCPFACALSALPDDCPHCETASAERQAVTRPASLVELPLGVTEDRVAGTLDIERALKTGEKHFEPGLLASAHRGLLYIDEVNLLSDHIVDVLLDAAAMGVNYVEREGVSVSHAASFILVGTMNPEEGELRPQLLDRFGLAVDVEAERDVNARTEVVRRRIAFDQDPEAFQARWSEAETAEQQRLVAARQLLPQVHLDDALLTLIAGICTDFGVDGMRADIVMYRAAVALAAYEGRTDVIEDDVRRVARLVLPHRRRRQPFDQPNVDDQELDESLERHRPPQDSGPPPSPSSEPDGSPTDAPPEHPPEPSAEGLAPQDQQAQIGQSFAVTPLEGPVRQALMQRSMGKRSRSLGGRSGHYVTSREPQDRVRDIAVDATLRAAAPNLRQRRREGEGSPAIHPSDLREKVRESRVGNLILFAVDASGSMGARDRMIATKGAIMSLLLDAYQKRDRVGLVSFRGREASVLLPPTSSVELAQHYLADMRTGGRTPLAAGLAKAHELLVRYGQRDRETQPLLVLLTDGRANAGIGAGDPVTEGLLQAGALRQAGVPSLVVDTEQGAMRLGLAQRLAEALGGVCLRMEELAANTLAGAVRLSLVGG